MFRELTNQKVDVTIYTDGACSGNPGTGGWAIVALSQEGLYDCFGGKQETTNNEMELQAFVNALEYCRENKIKSVRIHSDSAYVINAILRGWLKKWQENGWKTVEGKDLKNQNLWRKVAKYMEFKPMVFEVQKVRGHVGDPLNERADMLAKAGIEDAKNK